jgi:putative ABC transport system permease protein
MSFFLTVQIAMRALIKHKMRAALTVLGIVIGVAAVTTLVSIGQSADSLVRGELEGLGTNVLIVFPSGSKHGGVRRGSMPTLTSDDAEAIRRECPEVLAASPIVGAMSQVVYRNTNWSPRETLGVGEDFLIVRDWEVRLGGFLSPQDIDSAAKVCVIGQTLAEKLFQTANPVGKKIRVNNIPFLIIGVLEKKGANIGGEDQDDILLAPYTTVRKRMRGSMFDRVDVIIASARSDEETETAQHEIEQLLCDRHGIFGNDKDFEIMSMKEITAMLGKVTMTMTALLAAIAGVSLLVGGVGIMNIMLVSVTERTREIGIRMAVGARPCDILRQFLVESLVLCLIGGLIGLGVGIAGSVGLTLLINSLLEGTDWPIVFSGKAAILAISFSAAVGLFFGYYPARRASRLDPIEALRYE